MWPTDILKKPLPVPSTSSLTRMPPALIVLTLALLLGVQPITTDLYLPALPGLTQELGASMAQAQLTLTALLLAFGVSQLFWGPLSDRFGRRPVLLIGMSAYVLASLGSAVSPSMDVLIIWRALQGAAMGAAVMCARAIVRDLYTPVQGASVMSKGLSGLGVIACLSAPLGGLLTALFNWHAALLALSVFGAVSLALIALRFEETIPAKNPQALQFGTLMRTWLGILRNPTFLAFTALSTFAYSGLFTFLASSSFVFIRVLGLTTTQYGLVMFANSFIYLLGTFLCRRLLLRFGVRRTVAIAGALTLAGGGTVAALAFAGVQSVWAIEVPFALFMLAHGIHNPCGQSGAVGPFPQAAGAASALNGFLAMVSAFATGQWLGAHMDGTTGPLVMGILFWSVLIALSAWTLVQRYGKH
jgi:DHA1 family bicyclomycin/chloramphenicol resistance-like MFS transporter